MHAHYADVLQQDPVGGHLFNLAAHEPDDQQPPVPPDALGRQRNQAHGVVHDVHAPCVGRQAPHAVRPVRIPVVDCMICAKVLCDLHLVRRPRRRNDPCAKRLCDLHGREAHAPSGSVHEHPVAGADAGALHERAVAGGRRDEEPRRVGKGPAGGHGQQAGLLGADARGVAALGGTEDAGADGEPGARKAAGGSEDDAGELGARDPREGGLVLVLAGDLEQVEEVGGGGVDGDEVLRGGGGGIGEGGDPEVKGALCFGG